MRIGSLTALAFQKYDRSEPRDTVTKHIPGYVQTFSYDLLSTNPTIQIDGVLVGTSNANLASQIETLKAIHRSKRVVWIDATDQYQGLLDFCRITKLQGPTMDSKSGPLVATFSLEAVALLPWGTTHSNPWRATGIVLRDLSGVGQEYVLNPLSMNCNYVLSSALQGGNNTLSWEFILENQNPFTNATGVQEQSCDSTGGQVNNPGTIRSAMSSIGIDTTNFKEGTASAKGTINSPVAGSFYGFGYDLGSAGLDFSAYDRYVMWFMCDQAAQSGYLVEMIDTSNRYRQWGVSLQGANTWMRVEVPMNSYSAEASGFDLTHVRYVDIGVGAASSSPPASINIWMDDVRVEVGYINHCEDTSYWTGDSVETPTFANDTSIFKEGSASVKATGTSTTGGEIRAAYSLTVGTIDFTQCDFLLLWVRSDFGGASSGTFHIWYLSGGPNGGWNQFNYPNCSANQWYRLVVPLRNPASTGNSPNNTEINCVKIGTVGTASVSTNLWVDEIALDYGKWVNLEFMLPDNVSQAQGATALQAMSWNGSAYLAFYEWDAFGASGSTPNFALSLDGSSFDSLYGTAYGVSAYAPDSISTVAQRVPPSTGNSSSITYTSTYGPDNRVAVALKIPPATSDSNTGNYPSNDITGFAAINKARLKLIVSFANEDTTYSGF